MLIVVQGVEAGGHVCRACATLSVLVPEVADTVVELPVAASGGIVDGRGLAVFMAFGADGVHCGTVFLASPGIRPSPMTITHKQRIVDAGNRDRDGAHRNLFVINWPKARRSGS